MDKIRENKLRCFLGDTETDSVRIVIKLLHQSKREEK
jgi:hypothetical protein